MDLDSYFPYDSYYPKQRDTLKAAAEALWENDYDNVIIDMPTGGGKSAINYTLGKISNSAFYTTPLRQLRQQLINDKALSDGLFGLKSRRDYTCQQANDDFNKVLSCDDCPIKTSSDRSCGDEPHCTYWINKEKAMRSHIAVLTFAYLIVDYYVPEEASFGNRELLIVDEGHNLKDQARSLHAGFNISPYNLPYEVYNNTVDHIDMGNLFTYDDISEEVKEIYNKAGEYISEYSKYEDEDIQRQVNQCESIKRKIDWLLQEVNDDRVWVVNADIVSYAGKGRINLELKPIKVDNFLQRHIWSRSDKRILSTATMPYRDNPWKWLNSLGLSRGDTKVIHVGSSFPKKNRPIYTGYMTDSLTSGRDEELWDEIMKTLNEIASQHRGENGLIHTTSYNRAEKIFADSKGYEFLKGNVMYYGGGGDTEGFINMWQKSDKDIFVSPTMTDGVDLKDNKCRWQVLLKVPFPTMDDNQWKYLLEEEPAIGWPEYYEMAGVSIVQSVGRAVRSMDDHANFYVIDGSFEKIRKMVKLPEWFEEAIIEGKPNNSATEW